MLTVIREYPLDSIQSGAVSGNGKIGAMLWGGGNILNVSLGCADLWDHRGGMEWTPKQNFRDIRSALERGDMDTIKKIFATGPAGTERPTLMPLGRITLTLPENCTLLRFEIQLETGLNQIVYERNGKENTIFFTSDMSTENAVFCSGLPENTQIRLIPSYELFRDKDLKRFRLCAENSMADCGYEIPFQTDTAIAAAFIQPMPADPSFGIFLQKNPGGFSTRFFRGATRLEEVADTRLPVFKEVQEKSAVWWKNYWTGIPAISIPDPELEEIYWFGLYKYGIMTNPAGVTPGLQGPWIEDDRQPPWQGDYHFNINVQMCNSPGFKSGRFANLRILFDLVLSWKETLRKNAEYFCGIPDGYLLPHAVDDRCRCMGSFWSGSIDHGCAAWLAMMMFDYYDYSGDLAFLKDSAFDFMCGVMRVFRQMMERRPDGSLVLPVSISPEYNGSAINAWGANSSFQLAAVHRLAQNLIRAAGILGLPEDPFWREVETHLPLCSLFRNNGTREIALWEGQPLEECHRHHSHLAGITPFEVIDPDDPQWSGILDASILRWTSLGMGQWTGWCVPWASQLRTRFGHPDMAVLLLHLWKTVFSNAGGGSLHDGVFKGFTIFDFRGEVMQIDGAMGAVSAVQDLFVYAHNGIFNFFRGIPKSWKRAEFHGMFLPGGFSADGVFEKGKTVSLKITCRRTGLLRFRTPDHREIQERRMSAGEVLEFGS